MPGLWASGRPRSSPRPCDASQKGITSDALSPSLHTGLDGPLLEPAVVVHAIADAPDPSAAILTIQVDALTRTATHSHRVAAHLARVLCPVLAEHAPDAATTRAALALEREFTGTLADLLATARTIAT